MKVALVHDWLTGMRGGEKCLEALCELFPGATIFTLIHTKGSVSPLIEAMNIKTSFIQTLPFVKSRYRNYLPLFPTAIEQFDLRGFDLIISSSHCVAKGIIPHPDSYHICYCHTPMRYIWSMYEEYFGRGRERGISGRIIPFIAHYLRIWDTVNNCRIDKFIANSENVKKRIWRYYRREAEVIYPPLDTQGTKISTTDNGYFLIVSALTPYKRIDIAIEAFNRLGERLLIIGTGQDEKKLKRMADRNIEFLGWVEPKDLPAYYAKCRALIFPGEEDFGLVPLEAQCYGKAVIAHGAGGALETVRGRWLHSNSSKGEHCYTGIFFPKQTYSQIIEAVREFMQSKYNPQFIRDHALKFDKEIFKTRISQIVQEKQAMR